VDPTLLMYQQEGPHAQYAPESQHTSFTVCHGFWRSRRKKER
jgi:hypothetical protein